MRKGIRRAGERFGGNFSALAQRQQQVPRKSPQKSTWGSGTLVTGTVVGSAQRADGTSDITLCGAATALYTIPRRPRRQVPRTSATLLGSETLAAGPTAHPRRGERYILRSRVSAAHESAGRPAATHRRGDVICCRGPHAAPAQVHGTGR